MTKNHYIQIAICVLLCTIAGVLFNYYYQTYIAPESFVIGSVEFEPYKTYPIKDYLSDENIVFSQNINDVSFSSKDGISIYEYNFDAKKFNGLDNDYLIYVNNYIVNNITENAGTISGIYNLNYYDVEKNVLCSSSINIDFSFYSLQSKLKVSLNSSELGYLMNYFRTDNFIITLSENPFIMNNQDTVVESSPKDELGDITAVINSNKEVTVLYNDEEKTYTVDGSLFNSVKVAEYTAKAKDSISISFQRVNYNLLVNTDGTYNCEYNSETGFFDITWEGASYVTIEISQSVPSGGGTV